jgi:WXG100 family type VII secretion target
MSADTIQSQYENLQQVAQRFARRAETIQQLHSNVTRQTQKLAGTWEGKAATAFMQEMRTTLFPGLQRLSKALEQSSRTTTKIAQVLRQAEEEAARLFQGKAEGGFPAEGMGGGGLANGGMGGGGLENGGMVTLAQYSPPSQGGTPAQTDEGYTIEDVNQTELSVFFSQYEDSDYIPADVLEKYLTNPELIAIQREVITNLAERVQNGEPPLTPQQFYEMVLAETGDPGTALIVAHNITKALARGSESIGWENISREPLTYQMDGQDYTFDPNTFHSDALATNNGTPSVFYAMFSADALGTSDPGDWYHYYVQASASYLGATRQLNFNDPGLFDYSYSSITDTAIDNTMDQMRDDYGRDSNSDAVMGWTYANSLSFLEGAVYGSDYADNAEQAQAEVLRESNLHREGALFGLELAGVTPTENMVWNVPTAGSIEPPDADDWGDRWNVFWGNVGANMEEDTNVVLNADGSSINSGEDGTANDGNER